MLRRHVAGQQSLDGGQEVVGHGAADAAVGEFDDLVLAAALDAATGEQVAVDPDVAELVDHQGDAPAIGGLQQMADQAGLAGTEKAGDDRGRNLAIGLCGP